MVWIYIHISFQNCFWYDIDRCWTIKKNTMLHMSCLINTHKAWLNIIIPYWKPIFNYLQVSTAINTNHIHHVHNVHYSNVYPINTQQSSASYSEYSSRLREFQAQVHTHSFQQSLIWVHALESLKLLANCSQKAISWL